MVGAGRSRVPALAVLGVRRVGELAVALEGRDA